MNVIPEKDRDAYSAYQTMREARLEDLREADLTAFVMGLYLTGMKDGQIFAFLGWGSKAAPVEPKPVSKTISNCLVCGASMDVRPRAECCEHCAKLEPISDYMGAIGRAIGAGKFKIEFDSDNEETCDV
jgi:hypothetical protein